MKVNHTQRTVAWCADRGMIAGNVERFEAFSGRKHDLFGCIDIVAIGPAGVWFIQVTSRGEMGRRVRKIEESDAYGHLVLSGARVLVLGWHQPGGKGTRWVPVERWIIGGVEVAA